MNKHIIILLIMTLFVGMTLSAQENEISRKKDFIESIKRLDKDYLFYQGRSNEFEAAKTNARREFEKKLKDFVANWTLSEDEWTEMKDGVYNNIKQVEYEKDGVWRVFVYVGIDVVYHYLPSRYKFTMARTTETTEEHIIETYERTSTRSIDSQKTIVQSNDYGQNNAEASAVGKSMQKEDNREIESEEWDGDDEQMSEASVSEEESKIQDKTQAEEVEAVQKEPGAIFQEEMLADVVETAQDEPKQEVENTAQEAQETQTAQEPPIQRSGETELVEILPDVPEMAVKLSSSTNDKDAAEDTTGITDFMRSVKKCEKILSVRDLVATYKKDGLKLEYKKPASPHDTAYYLVVYIKGGSLLAILTPAEKGEVIDIISGEPDRIENYSYHKPAVSLEGFKFLNEE